jgi:hypothetical protein
MRKRSLPLLLICGVLAAGIVSPTKSSADDQQQDVNQAEQACSPVSQWATRAAYTACVGDSERPVLVKYEPRLVVLYDMFQKDRMDLSRQYDTGQIDATRYAADERSLESNFIQEVNDIRNRSSESASAPAQTPSQPSASSAQSFFGALMGALADFNSAYWSARAQQEAQRPAPSDCTAQTIGQFTYTHCN